MMLCGSYYNHPTMNLLLVLITTSVLAQGPDGAYGLDPDKKGEQVWQYRAGRGSAIGGVWGSAVDAQQAYIAVAGYFTPDPADCMRFGSIPAKRCGTCRRGRHCAARAR